MQLTDDRMLKRAAFAIQCWNQGDIDELLAHYRDDAVLGLSSSSLDREWIQGRENIKQCLEEYRRCRPQLNVIDYHVGGQFYTAILSDQSGIVTLHIETDAEAAVKRVIISHSIWESLGFGKSDQLFAKPSCALNVPQPVPAV
jgi:hypothetical protein